MKRSQCPMAFAHFSPGRRPRSRSSGKSQVQKGALQGAQDSGHGQLTLATQLFRDSCLANSEVTRLRCVAKMWQGTARTLRLRAESCHALGQGSTRRFCQVTPTDKTSLSFKNTLEERSKRAEATTCQ